MTARQAVRAEAIRPPLPPPPVKREQLGMAWWAQDQGAESRMEGMKRKKPRLEIMLQ